MLKEITTPEYLTVAEATKILNVSASTLRNWTDEGKIDGYVTAGGHRRYLEHELHLLAFRERLIAQGRQDNPFYTATAVMTRQGDKFTVSFPGDDAEDVDVANAGDAPFQVEVSKLRLKVEDMKESTPGKIENVWLPLERRFIYTGQPQFDIGNTSNHDLEVWGNADDGAYIQQWIHALADNEEATRAAMKKAIAASHAFLLKHAVPVYGVCGYANADGHVYPQAG